MFVVNKAKVGTFEKYFLHDVVCPNKYLRKDGTICFSMDPNNTGHGGTYFDFEEEAKECLANFNNGSLPAQQIMRIQVKCSDLCNVQFPNGKEHDGYVPKNIGLGGGDYIDIEINIYTGQIVGWDLSVYNSILIVQDNLAER